MNPIYIITNRKRNTKAKCTWDLYCEDKFIDDTRAGAELHCIKVFTPDENSSYAIMKTDQAFQEMQEVMMDKKIDAVYYGHGFNNSFEDAIKGYFKLQQLTGSVVFGFSWPSKITGLPFEDYREKKKFAMLSVPAFDRVMGKLYNLVMNSKKNCGQEIHAMAHSMHNYLWQGAVNGQGCYDSRRQIFYNICITEADINANGSEKFLEQLKCRGKVFVTVNEKDIALTVSQVKIGKKQKRRRGTSIHPMLPENDNVCIVDFTKAKGIKREHTFFKGHSNKNVNGFFKDIFNGGDGLGFMDEVIPNKLYRVK